MTAATATHQYLFLAGAPRSGTTLLQLVLSAHPEILITPETTVFQDICFWKPDPQSEMTPKAFNHVVQMIHDDPKLNTWPNFSPNDFIENLQMLEAPTLCKIFDSLFSDYARNVGKRCKYLGNKKGLTAQGYGPYLKRMFPSSKFIFIVRDPRDIVRSIIENLSPQTLEQVASMCSRRFRFMERLRRSFPMDTHFVHYEELVTEPERACRAMCQFLGVDFDNQMLHYYESNRDGSNLIGVTRQIHKNTTRPFSPELIQQWKKKDCYSPNQLRTLERLAWPYMNAYGYARESSPATILEALIRLRMHLRFLIEDTRTALARCIRSGLPQ